MVTFPALVHYTSIQAARHIPNPEWEAGGIGSMKVDGREAVLWDPSRALFSTLWGPFSPPFRPSGPLQDPPLMPQHPTSGSN